ncbi:Ankyrin repeat and BTB/POZ domain-containing protein 1 [Pleodorina starrii]|nr:Ankyrin repeat and BTB/POZ domain-containing protein 1 [Pleodorina starrii]GLC73634.1 Ankyrin repeat and BTB/POZ domain-containing protein 1 [Pleodorina starrii]
MLLSCEEVSLPKYATGVVVRPLIAQPTSPTTATTTTITTTTTTTTATTTLNKCNAFPRIRSTGTAVATTAARTLIFFGDEVRELIEVTPTATAAKGNNELQTRPTVVAAAAAAAAAATAVASDDDDERTLIVSAKPLQITGQALRAARQPIYEPHTDSVLFVEGYAIKRLDGSYNVDLVAGSEGEWGYVDGPGGGGGGGGAARFRHIVSLAADGTGRVFVAEKKAIRAVDVASGAVSTLRGSEPPANQVWTSLSYDAAAGVLVAATMRAVYHFPPSGLPYNGAAEPRVIAGGGDAAATAAAAGGGGALERSCSIRSILAGADGRVLIGEQGRLRSVDAAGTVSTHLAAAGVGAEGYFPWQMALLPGGRLAMSGYGLNRLVVVNGGNGGIFTPSGGAAATAETPVEPTATAGGDGKAGGQARAALASALIGCLAAPTSSSSSGGDAAAASGTVTVTTRDGKAFVAHRGVLAARSAYFRRLLSAGGGFADSGASGGAVSLPDADSEAFGRLLVYMYTGELVLPDELLRPAAVLASRLLLPPECLAELQARLLAGVTPGSVLFDLVWAERQGMSELVPRLLDFLMVHRREVAAEASVRMALTALITLQPELTAQLLRQLLAL